MPGNGSAEETMTLGRAAWLVGVAVLVLPGDIALRSAPKRAISPNAGLLPAAPIVRPAEAELKALADLLNGGKRVTLFCGRGCAGAHDGLMMAW